MPGALHSPILARHIEVIILGMISVGEMIDAGGAEETDAIQAE